MKYFLTLLIAMAVIFYAATAQDIGDFDIRHFNTENGLPQNSIKGIAADDYGFIWMASEAGLLRYDGQNFSIYNKKNTGTVANRILTIARIPGQAVLLAIPDRGNMLSLDKGKAHSYPHSLNTVFLQQPEHAGHKGDSILDFAFRKYKYIDRQLLFPGNTNMAILHLKNGIRWYRKGVLMTQMPLPPLKDFSSVFVLGKAVFIAYERLSSGMVTCIEPGKSYQVKIGGDFSRQMSKNNSGETFFITNDATGTVFLSSGDNLYVVSQLADGSLHTRLLLSGFGLLTHQVNSVYYDPAHSRLFLGSSTEGLFVLTRKKFFTSLYPGKDPYTNVFYSLVPLSDSSLLSGSGLVFSTQKGSKPLIRELLRKPGNYGYELFRSSGGIWFCYGMDLYQLDFDARKIVRQFK